MLVNNFDFGATEILFFLLQMFFLIVSKGITNKNLPNLSWFQLIGGVLAKFFFMFYLLVAIIGMKLNLSNVIAYLLGFIVFLPKINLPNPTIFGKKIW